MRRTKNNGDLNKILVVIIILLIILIVLLATGTVSFKSNNVDMNNEPFDFNKLAKISKSDYNFVNREYTDKHSLIVLDDGRIYVDFLEYISNIDNALDLVIFSGPGTGDIAYFLTKDGNIYKYDLADIEKNKFEASKIEKYSNIEKIIRYETRKGNAGGCGYVVLIDNNGKYYSLDSYCV